MAQTFAALKTSVKEMLWPDGVPENHEAAINRFIVDGLYDIQLHIACFQQDNTTRFEQCGTYFKCGTSWFTRPNGVINKLRVVQDEACSPVTYRMTTPDEVYKWSRSFWREVTSPENTGMPTLPDGYKYPESSTDSQYGRALTGVWAIDKGNIVLAPWLQSDETVVVYWDGIKQDYDDADEVSDDKLLEKVLRSYVKFTYEGEFGTDTNAYKLAEMRHGEAYAELMLWCRNQTRLREHQQSGEEADDLIATRTAPEVEDDYVEPALVFAAFGDYGVDDDNEAAVAELVKSWSPDHILALGDNNYEDGAADTIDANIGKYFRKFIYPYTGAEPLGDGESDATANRFWPCLGNHDLDTEVGGIAGKPYFDYFDLPGNERFYDFVKGNVHFFVVNSGINTAGDVVEPMGNDFGSIQSELVAMRIAQSTAKWKVVYLHHPPYTSSSSYSPGSTALRWVMDLPVDLILAGHAHNYERIEKDGKPPLIICGTGGKDLVGFADVVDTDSRYRYSDSHGALKLTVTCSAIQIEFRDTDDNLIDFKIIGTLPTTTQTVESDQPTTTDLSGLIFWNVTQQKYQRIEIVGDDDAEQIQIVDV